VRWKYRSSMPVVAGVTPTAGGLIFAGELNGDAIALDAKTGAVLWRQPTRNAIGGGVITYRRRRQAVARRRRRLQVTRLAGTGGVESNHRVRAAVTVLRGSGLRAVCGLRCAGCHP
jgi:outer membrane protein assembly factor BamB